MITEDYVSFETAKLLKEKEFDCACKAWYSEYASQFGGAKYAGIEFDDHNRFEENYKFICYAPTLQMVMKWLREKHNIVCNIDIESRNFYYYSIFIIKSGTEAQYQLTSLKPYFKTYEEACEAVIKYCLENLV